MLLPSVVYAHVFLQPYTLPVPFWLYLYAAAATLILSFAIIGMFVGTLPAPWLSRKIDVLPETGAFQKAWAWTLLLLRIVGVGCLLATIVGGLVGTPDPQRNIGMPLFWVVFLLGLTYLTAVIGNIYELTNPWRSLLDALERLGLDLSRRRVRYPEALGYLPAFALYVALIWIELFTFPRPHLLSVFVSVYSLVTFLGVLMFGKHTWFEFGELFSVFFRAIGTMAPVEYEVGSEGRPGRIFLRVPFVSAFHDRPRHVTIVLFVMFMLSSTTYDAMHETFFWVSLYWQRLLPALQPLWGGDLLEAQSALTSWYVVYQRLGLVASPFIYLLLYVLVLACARRVSGTNVPLTTLAGQFALSLVPIALVYHSTHYYTILITELPKLPAFAADPFGLEWQLFAPAERTPGPLDMGTIWHSQVLLMLAGHVVAVYLAHLVALRVFPSHRQGVMSQLPMLVLMVAYTCLGLWVLSLPLAVPQVLPIG